MSAAATSRNASSAPAATDTSSLDSRDRSSVTAPIRLYTFSSVIADRRFAGIGCGLTRLRRLRARYSSPCISTSRLGVWRLLRSRTRSKT